jgi:mono/diheme cytochrome c family protein
VPHRSPRSIVLACLASAALVLALACSREQKTATAPEGAPSATAPPPAAPAPAAPAVDTGAAKAEAKKIFSERCVPCHGANGAGNGPASAGLTPPPRNFQDPEWQKSVTNEHIEQIIQYGGAAVGKSPAMPSNPDLTSKPEVVTALQQYIRSLPR